MMDQQDFESVLESIDKKRRFRLAVSLMAIFTIATVTVHFFAPVFTDDFYYVGSNCSQVRLSVYPSANGSISNSNLTLAQNEDLNNNAAIRRFALTQCSEQPWALGSMASLAVGMFIGSLIGTSLANRGGRRLMLLLSLVVILIFSPMTLMAPRLAHRIILRLFLGLGLSGCLVASLLYLADTLLISSRRKGTIMEVGVLLIRPLAAMPMGLLFLTLLAIAVRHYIGLQIALTCIIVLPLVTAFLLPESPVWRFNRGDKAYDKGLISSLNKIARWNDHSDPTLGISLFDQLQQPEAKLGVSTALQSQSRLSQITVFHLWIVLHVNFSIFASTGLAVGDLPATPVSSSSSFAGLTGMALVDILVLVTGHILRPHIRRWTHTCLVGTLLLQAAICALIVAVVTATTVAAPDSEKRSGGAADRVPPLIKVLVPVHALSTACGGLAFDLLLREGRRGAARSAYFISGIHMALLVIPIGSSIWPGLPYALWALMALLLALIKLSLLMASSPAPSSSAPCLPTCCFPPITLATVAGETDHEGLLLTPMGNSCQPIAIPPSIDYPEDDNTTAHEPSMLQENSYSFQ